MIIKKQLSQPLFAHNQIKGAARRDLPLGVSWSRWADEHTWKLIGLNLKREAIDELGEDKVIDVELDSVLWSLRDCGCHSLAGRIEESIEVNNAQTGDNK